jgi:hypothetical protein
MSRSGSLFWTITALTAGLAAAASAPVIAAAPARPRAFTCSGPRRIDRSRAIATTTPRMTRAPATRKESTPRRSRARIDERGDPAGEQTSSASRGVVCPAHTRRSTLPRRSSVAAAPSKASAST